MKMLQLNIFLFNFVLPHLESETELILAHTSVSEIRQ